jgi:anti-anti-sigma factor
MGAEVIALPLATLSGTRENIVIDMSDVTFLASIGIRHLVSAAKGVSRRNGRVFLLKPTSFVVDVITTSGLEDILHLAATDAEVPSFGHV